MKRHVGDFVRRCLTCQQVKAEHQKPAGLLQPLEVAEWKWEHVTMDFVSHFPRTPRRHDAVWGDSRPAHEVGTFSSRADDLHTGGILSIIHSRDRSAASTHSVGQGPEVYSALLEEFPKGYGDTADQEYSLPPTDRWSDKDDHTGVRGHAASMRHGS